LKKRIKIFYELGKVKITFFVTLSTAVGYILGKGVIDLEIIPLLVGVFLLACGSSAMNHFQERIPDSLMERTKQRPIPSGRIFPSEAFAFSILLFLIGSVILLHFTEETTLLLGWLAFGWYNLIYTPLKRKTPLAVLPGALIGAIPPLMGWTATGKGLFEAQGIALALFFFIWQIPHFWLLVLLFEKDYLKAGFPVLTAKFNKKQLSRITFSWIVALALSCLLLPFYELTNNVFTSVFVLLSGVILIFYSVKILKPEDLKRKFYRMAFIRLNLFVLIIIFSISLDVLFF